jgi:hypothetical protein
MSAVRGKLFGNRPTPANDAQHLSHHYEPDNETSEAWDASSNGWGDGHRRGGDTMAAMVQMIARTRTRDSKLAEPLLPAEPAPDALFRFGPRAGRGAGEPLLKRSTPAAQSSASSATEEPGLPHRAGPWRLAGWGALGVGAPSLAAVAIVMLAPTLRPLTPLESTDQATHPRAASAAPTIPAADMTRALPGEPRAPSQIGEAAAPVRPDFTEGVAVPPSAIAVSPALLPATEAAADADRRMAEVQRKMDALSAEMDTLFAEVVRLEGHQDSTSRERNKPPASRPPVVAVSPVAREDARPAPPLASVAAADADRGIAAVELERDVAAAEVDRLQSHRDSTSREQNKPPAPPPAVAVSPVAREDARPAPSVVHAGVADLASDETCRRDGDRLARLRASPSGEEAQRFASELGCEALRPQVQRLMENLGLVAPAPPSAANSTASSDGVLAQLCASERAALDSLRKEPSAEAARLFWRDLKCARLRPQVRLLMDSLNATPRPLGSAAEPGEADSR